MFSLVTVLKKYSIRILATGFVTDVNNWDFIQKNSELKEAIVPFKPVSKN